MAAPVELRKLVQQFLDNRDTYLSDAFGETAVRLQFIDPLFELLGWDVYNRLGYAEAYKDVVHEDSLKVGGSTKAPDYSFRIGGVRKFFVEAKKPAIRLNRDIAPAFQLRRYAWSAKLPLSILTNFEEFAVYDCRVRPEKGDNPGTARTLYITLDQYEERWDEIAAIFSHEAILKGSFDRYAESNKKKRGTAEVDAAFLEDIEQWRFQLARNLALRNPGLSQRDLNFAVQKTIDRIIFLRICEDRGVETYGRLQVLPNGPGIYPRLCELFHEADHRYNSGLFHFAREKERRETPDEWTLSLAIDDGVLKDIIRKLYYPESPYEFSVIGADILGQVYEQFLGKVIRLTPGHQAKVEEKPEVRKAGGVYYTPTYIVEYIVKHTVGKLVEGRTPFEVAARTPTWKPAKGGRPLSVLDPACGSGSFLIGAYQYLLDWYRDGFVAGDPRRHKDRVYQTAKGQWRLSTAERKRILLDHIYGVDIDPQAVEVTKLSLLLKVLEGETKETLQRQLFAKERALPDLSDNIKCGNSLIGPDFYQGQQLALFDDEQRLRINAFDWTAEYSPIMKSGGFDAVLGNPPYIRIQAMKEWAPVEVEFYKQRYHSASQGNYDIYVVFVERGLGLLNETGLLGFILPHKFFNSQYGQPLRHLLAAGKHLSHVVHFGDQQVFTGATTYTCLLFLDRLGTDEIDVVRATDLDSWRANDSPTLGTVCAAGIDDGPWNFAVGRGSDIFERLTEMPTTLADVVTGMFVGQQTSADTVYLFKDSRQQEHDTTLVFSKELDQWLTLETDILKPVVRSGRIHRYRAEPTAFVLFPYSVVDCEASLLSPTEMAERFPLAWAYLKQNKALLTAREKGKFADDSWYRFGRTQNLGMWEQRKLMVPYMVTQLSAYLDRKDGFYFINVTTGGYGIISDERRGSLAYLCGLLNSRLLDFAFKRLSTTFHGGYFAANKQFIERLPIPLIDFANSADHARHDRIASLVDQMLSLYKRHAAARSPHTVTTLARQIATTSDQIDQLVYELYGLTDDEIRVVEQASTAWNR